MGQPNNKEGGVGVNPLFFVKIKVCVDKWGGGGGWGSRRARRPPRILRAQLALLPVPLFPGRMPSRFWDGTRAARFARCAAVGDRATQTAPRSISSSRARNFFAHRALQNSVR